MRSASAATGRDNGAVSNVPARLAPYLGSTANLTQLARRFVAAGYECYLVGGSVRDALMDRDITDLDLTTNARPAQIRALVEGWADAIWLQGERFGTVGAQRGDDRFEITTFRADVYVPESRKPEVTFGDTIEVDLGRRDLTVNAMALRLPDLELIDPFQGLTDLVAKKIRTPLSTEISFGDDPLRMLRAARFTATLEFEPVPEVVAAMTEMNDRLNIVSAERIRDELSKLLLARDPGPGLWLLARTGLADQFLPELTRMELEQDPIHRHKDVLAHSIAVVQNTRPELLVRLGALLHDIGKPKTRGFSTNGVTFHHHEVVGARMARKRMTELKYPSQVIDDVTALVELHLRFHTYKMGWTDAAVRRYVRDAGHLLDELNHLTRCDCTTRNKRKADMLSRRMDELESRIAELQAQEELASIRPPLDGRQVMDHLGVGPGRVVGTALAHLLELRLENGPMDEAAGYAALDEWAQAQGLNA